MSAPAGIGDRLGPLVDVYGARRPGWTAGPEGCEVLDAELLVPGRPAVWDVVARAGDRLVHVPVGLREPGDDVRAITDGEDPVLGVLDDGTGEAVAFDALRDGETAGLLLQQVTGAPSRPGIVRQVAHDESSVTIAVEDRLAFTVYDEVVDGPRPEVEVVLALDETGFNHLAAPLTRWRRDRWDLGLVQEHLAGHSTGWALALTSVRDLYASGGPPELAGGDFGAEAHRLGTMAARLHLALAEAFGRRRVEVRQWADAVEVALEGRRPGQLERPDVSVLLGELRALPVAGDAIRTHGDFHLGRVWRTEQGWYVGDFRPGGRPQAAGPPPPPSLEVDGVCFRAPLADVADMLWSFAHVASAAAAERDPSGREGLAELAAAWEQRNRRAFLAGYLGVPGITTLVPPGREVVRVIVAALELERGSRAPATPPSWPAGPTAPASSPGWPAP